MKKHPRTADSIRDSHILSATIQEYSFTLFNLPQVTVSFDAYLVQIAGVRKDLCNRCGYRGLILVEHPQPTAS